MILSTRTKHPKHELIDLSAPGDILWLWRWLVHLAMSLFHSSQNRNHASQLQNRDAEMQSDILELPILFLAVSRKTSCCKWLHNQPQLSSAKWGIIDSNLRVRPYFLLGSWFSIFQVGSVHWIYSERMCLHFFFSSRRSTGFKVRKHQLQDQSFHSVLPQSINSLFLSVSFLICNTGTEHLLPALLLTTAELTEV